MAGGLNIVFFSGGAQFPMEPENPLGWGGLSPDGPPPVYASE